MMSDAGYGSPQAGLGLKKGPPTPTPFPSAGGEGATLGVQPVVTLIREDLTIEGKLTSKGKVILEGTIEGDLRCSSLVVGEKGQITGSVVADEVTVHGKAKGAIYGKSVELFASAEVQGNIFHHGIGMERGTRYDGTLKYVDDPIAAGLNRANERKT
jgi:cytoskeletal protein CcmA (bactofilin family)